MKFEYVEYLKITDSNSNCVELSLEEVAELYKKLQPTFQNSPPLSDEEIDMFHQIVKDEQFMTEEEDLNSDVPPEDVEKIREYMEQRESEIIQEIEDAFCAPRRHHKIYSHIGFSGDIYDTIIRERLKKGLSLSDYVDNYFRENLINQLKIDWRGKKYQIPESITDAELEKFEKFLEREGALESYNESERDFHYIGDSRITKMCLRIMWGYHEEFWEEMDRKWQQELKGENNGENN